MAAQFKAAADRVSPLDTLSCTTDTRWAYDEETDQFIVGQAVVNYPGYGTTDVLEEGGGTYEPLQICHDLNTNTYSFHAASSSSCSPYWPCWWGPQHGTIGAPINAAASGIGANEQMSLLCDGTLVQLWFDEAGGPLTGVYWSGVGRNIEYVSIGTSLFAVPEVCGYP